MGLYKKIKSGARSLILEASVAGIMADGAYNLFSRGYYKTGAILAVVTALTGIDIGLTYRGMARAAREAEEKMNETAADYKELSKAVIEAAKDEEVMKSGGLEKKMGN